MSKWATLQLKIHVKIKDVELLKEMVKPIDEFCDKHDVGVYAEYNKDNNYIIAIINATGRTISYCKGMTHEIKQMYKDIFKCKIETLLEAY